MATDCRAHQMNEVVPIIFEVYSDNGTVFMCEEDWAYCVICDDLKQEIERVTAIYLPQDDETCYAKTSSKKFLVSWDTAKKSNDGTDIYHEGYYLLQLWCKANFTGLKTNNILNVEMAVASEEIQRYVRS